MGSLDYRHSEPIDFGHQEFPVVNLHEIGPQVKLFLSKDTFLQKFFNPIDNKLHISKTAKPSGKLSWEKTLSNKMLQQSQNTVLLKDKHFIVLKSFTALNGDYCSVNEFVLAKGSNHNTIIAKVLEILQLPGSSAEIEIIPSLLLICVFRRGCNGLGLDYY